MKHFRRPAYATIESPKAVELVADTIRRNLIMGADHTARAVAAVMGSIEETWCPYCGTDGDCDCEDSTLLCECGNYATTINGEVVNGLCSECSYERYLEERTDQKAGR